MMVHNYVFSLILLIIAMIARHARSCTSDSKQLHICLNIYLERDYPQVEAILKAQWRFQTLHSRGHVLLEGPSLDVICRKIDELENCFAEVADECLTYPHIYQFDRMMRTLLAMDNLLCSSDSKDGLKALLVYAMCIRNVRQYTPECQDDTFDWDEIWKGMLRLEIGGEICKPLEKQTRCLVNSLQKNQCGPHAAEVYNQTIFTWLDSWCSSSCFTQASPVFLVASLLIIYLTHLDNLWLPYSFH